MLYKIITLFGESFDSYLGASILKRAIKAKKISVRFVNPRDFVDDKSKKVDDSPYGGGPGMVLKFEPIAKAVQSSKTKNPKLKTRVVLFSTRGKKFDSKTARRLAKYDELILICGRYEGVDERVAKYIADEEISIGDFVLEGGELPALVLIDAVSRHVSGVLGRHESLEEIKGSYPVYTRPEVVFLKQGKKTKKIKVPEVLLSGDHKKIEEWRGRSGS